MLASLLLVAVFLWVAVFKVRRRKLNELASRLPGPDKGDLPIVGIALSMTGNTEDIMKQVQYYSYQAMKKGGLLKLWCGHILFIAVLDPVDLEFILKTCLEKSDLHRFSRNVVGNGGIYAPVSIWRRRRKILVPTFSPKIVETFMEKFSQQSEKLASILSKFTDSGCISMWPFLSTYTLDSVCETTMGVKLNAQENPETQFLVAMNKLLNLVAERFFKIWLQPDWLYRFCPQYKQHENHVHKMHSFTDEVIKNKRGEMKTKIADRSESDTQNDIGHNGTKTFLEYLIKISGGKGEQGYTDLELREEVLTLAIAGTDTSAVAMGFTLTLLAKYPQVQEKVYQEINDVFGDSDRSIVKEDLVNLKYLERVVKESLRLFPPVPVLNRKLTQDIILPSNNVLPDGAIVAVSIWGMHRDPKYWGPEAEHFDPDRFLTERFNIEHACSYMPFSMGPRNCVGYQYAMMSIKTALSAILRKYKIVGEPETSPIPQIRVKLDLMMKAVDGYTVALQERKKEVH